MKLKETQVLLNFEGNSKKELFEWIASKAIKSEIITSEKKLVSSFEDREKEITTAMQNGFAIPHARFSGVKKAAVYFVRFKNEIVWDDDNNKVKNIIALLIPETQGDYLETLSAIAIKLLNDETVNKLKISNDKKEICEIINKKETQMTSVVSSTNATTIVGLSACPSGTAHTYMARDALLKAGKELGWNVYIETQGMSGPENVLTDEQIESADAVIVAADVGLDLSRFENKKVYEISTNRAINNPVKELQNTVNAVVSTNSKGKNKETDIFEIKKGKNGKVKWTGHIMAGIGYMIPFIVFAGIFSAIISGIWSQMGVHRFNAELGRDILVPIDQLTAEESAALTNSQLALKTIFNFAGIGFTVMMGIAGGFIANSIAGRSAIAPAFILTMMGNQPELNWQGYFKNVMVKDIAGGGDGMISLNAMMQPLTIFGAIIFGLMVGYLVRWINTSWKINKYIKPMMPVMFIPLFVTGTIGLIWIFTVGPLLGAVMGYVSFGLAYVTQYPEYMAAIGLLLGAMAGVDMGGPVNKAAFYGSAGIMMIDGGQAMGAVAGTSAVASMGCGIAALTFKKKFEGDKEIGINAVSLGFMGISEAAIPFAAKYGWPVFVANIVGSATTGAISGAFMVQGHVGGWGGPIIAVFAGVTDQYGSYIGIVWYLIAIAAGILVHVLLLRLLMGIKDKEKVSTLFKKEKVTVNARA